MKKISFGHRSWLLRRQKIRQRSAILRANVAHIRPRCQRDAILAPAYFCILPFADRNTKAVGEFFAFLQQVRGYKGSHLSIDMSQVTSLVATATLAFKAELSYLRAKGVDISGILPKKERIHQVLTQTGLCDLLGLPEKEGKSWALRLLAPCKARCTVPCTYGVIHYFNQVQPLPLETHHDYVAHSRLYSISRRTV